MSVRLWLVRHGSTEWSEAGRFNGWTDIPLTERGKTEAGALAWLAPRSWAGVWTSDLVRARSTAGLAGLDAVPDRRLREIDFGIVDGKTWDELDLETRDALVDFDGFAPSGGESTVELLARLEEFLSGLGSGDHLAFTHGGAIRALVRTTCTDHHPPPGDVTILEVDGASRRHLEMDFLAKPVDSGRGRSSPP